MFFDAATGKPAGAEELDSEPRGGILGVDEKFICALRDGRIWVFDVGAEVVRVDAQFGGRGRFLPAAISRNRLAVNVSGYGLAVLPIPR